MTDIFAIHQLVASEISYICPTKEDVLRELIHDLGSAKNNETEMIGVSSAEISLTLNPKLHDVEGMSSWPPYKPDACLTFL